MGKLDRIACVAAALLAVGCSDKRVRDPDMVASPRARQAQRGEAGAQAVDDRFDAQGRLKPSGRRFSWLELPAGFTQQPGSTDASGVWEARDMPVEKVSAYLEARLAANQVELRGNGVVYREAKATHTQLPLPPITATVLEIEPAAHGVRLVIDDLTPPREPPLPDRIAERELAKERSRME